jgi:hypothetical protein
MNRSPDDLPERLLAGGGATDFERRVLERALQKRPSSAASAGMAKVLGVTAGAVVTATVEGTARAVPKAAVEAGASNATVAPGAAVWPWVTVSVVGLALAGLVGTRAWRPSPPRPTPVAPQMAPAAAAPAPVATDIGRPMSTVPEPAPSLPAAAHHPHAAAASGDLRDEITFLDGARAALSAGDGRRALELVRRYQEKYPGASFRPEATAIKIEALLKLDRQADARALAVRFVTKNRGSLLAKRVAALVGLDDQAAPPGTNRHE